MKNKTEENTHDREEQVITIESDTLEWCQAAISEAKNFGGVLPICQAERFLNLRSRAITYPVTSQQY